MFNKYHSINSFPICLLLLKDLDYTFQIRFTYGQYLVRDIKPPNHQFWFPQFFPQIFLSWERKQSLFSFSTAKSEKNSWKKLRKARLVVWCHNHEQDTIPIIFYPINKMMREYFLYILDLTYTTMPNKIEQGASREILWWNQGYPAITTGFSLLKGKTVMIVG